VSQYQKKHLPVHTHEEEEEGFTVKTRSQVHNQSRPDGQLRLTASSFNQLDQYVCSPGCEKIEQK